MPMTPFPFPLTTLRALGAAAVLAAGAAPVLAAPGAAPCGMAQAHGGHHGSTGHGPGATLTVQGEGRAGVAPDTATISLGVTTQGPTASQAMADNATRQATVIEALGAQGIEARDIQTSGLNLTPLQDYSQEGKPPVITGYQAQNMVTIRVRDIARLGGVLDGLVQAGANEIGGIAFARDDQTGAEDAARRDAVDSARHRAEVLAQAAGMRLGPLVALNDSGASAGPMPMMAMARDAKESAATPIEAGELNVTAQVGATFALLPQEGGAEGAPACPMMPGGPGAAPQGAPGLHDQGMHHGMHHGMHGHGMHHGMPQGMMHGQGMPPGMQGHMPGMAMPERPEGSADAPAAEPAAPDTQAPASSAPAGDPAATDDAPAPGPAAAEGGPATAPGTEGDAAPAPAADTGSTPRDGAPVSGAGTPSN